MSSCLLKQKTTRQDELWNEGPVKNRVGWGKKTFVLKFSLTLFSHKLCRVVLVFETLSKN